MAPVTRSSVVRAGLDAGLVAVGTTSARPFASTQADLIERRARGLHADMQFTYRNPERSTDPERALPGARSIVVGALEYRQSESPPADPVPRARVAAYARADHYADLRRALTVIADLLRGGGHRALVLADQNDLVDRAAAHRAGIGWWGKSSNILVPGVGSMVVLGSVVTDAEIDELDDPVDDQCGTCRACLDGCPTGAIVEPGVVDANRCLAWLVQATGMFPAEYREALGDRIYGCDECQDVCPPNRLRVRRSRAPGGEATLPVLEVLAMTDDEILHRFGRWYIPRRQARYVRRNALVVLGNVGHPGDAPTRDVVESYLRHDDPLLRAHAVWCARRLGVDVSGLADDPDPLVRAELAR